MKYNINNPNVKYVIENWDTKSTEEMAKHLKVKPRTIIQIAHLVRKQGIKLSNKLFKKTPLSERFWEKVEKTDGCWNWTGAKHKAGYGKIGNPDGHKLAHRVSWTMAYGEIPNGFFICHKCDNPSCVKPSHLFLGTPQDNVDDMFRKKRNSHGEKHHKSKLTKENVEKIRKLYKQGKYYQYELANMLGVCQAQINRIINEKRWSHVQTK